MYSIYSFVSHLAGTIPAWLAIVFMIVMIFVVFVFCSYIGI